MHRMRPRLGTALLVLAAVTAIGIALWHLAAATAGVTIATAMVGPTPVTVYRPTASARRPVVVIAHGFAGSQQLMQSFALTCARNGYIAVTFDFPGHGHNAVPLSGSITQETGATRTLVEALGRVVDYARPLGDGRIAVLGHSMASDIVVRYAQQDPTVMATIAVSMYSPRVTATEPRNLLIIVGDWESSLKREALRAVGLATRPQPALAGVTYGDPRLGTARRAAFSSHVEHASVLYSQDSAREMLQWLDLTFGTSRTASPALDERGPWILLLIAAVVTLAHPLSRWLPRVAQPPVGANLPWRRLWLPLLLPMAATPALLRVLPTHFLPVLVGDYLAMHFLTYGLVTALCLRVARVPVPQIVYPSRLAAASSLVAAYAFIGLILPIDRHVTAFMPGPERWVLVVAMLAGTLAYFLADEWLTRGPAAARGAYPASKSAFLASLAIAVALDFERLFFLVIIIPVIVLFFVVHGLFSAWVNHRTGHPWVAGIANALVFAWAIGVTFPLLAG